MSKEIWLVTLGAVVCLLGTLCYVQHQTIAAQFEQIQLLEERIALIGINQDLCIVAVEKQSQMCARTKRIAETCMDTFDETFSGLGLTDRPKVRLVSLPGKEGGIGPVGQREPKYHPTPKKTPPTTTAPVTNQGR